MKMKKKINLIAIDGRERGRGREGEGGKKEKKKNFHVEKHAFFLRN